LRVAQQILDHGLLADLLHRGEHLEQFLLLILVELRLELRRRGIQLGGLVRRFDGGGLLLEPFLAPHGLGDVDQLLTRTKPRLVVPELRDELAHTVDFLRVRLDQVRKFSHALRLELAQHLLEPEGLRRVVHARGEVRHAPADERSAQPLAQLVIAHERASIVSDEGKSGVFIRVRRIVGGRLAGLGDRRRLEHLLLQNRYQLVDDLAALRGRHGRERVDQAGLVVRTLDAHAAPPARFHLDQRDRRIDAKLERVLVMRQHSHELPGPLLGVGPALDVILGGSAPHRHESER
jgi:hypothetical protein